MLEAKIKSLIQQGEGLQVEFKACNSALSKNIYETVCAFLNRSGRSHQSLKPKQINSNLHWKLDVSFKEDQSRSHARSGPQNLSTLRKMALFYLENKPS